VKGGESTGDGVEGYAQGQERKGGPRVAGVEERGVRLQAGTVGAPPKLGKGGKVTLPRALRERLIPRSDAAVMERVRRELERATAGTGFVQLNSRFPGMPRAGAEGSGVSAALPRDVDMAMQPQLHASVNGGVAQQDNDDRPLTAEGKERSGVILYTARDEALQQLLEL